MVVLHFEGQKSTPLEVWISKQVLNRMLILTYQSHQNIKTKLLTGSR